MTKAKVYTRTGDRGETSLADGQRVSKADARLEAYGTVDELGSQLGLLVTYLTDPLDIQTIEAVQQTLFDVCTSLATDCDEGQPFPPLPEGIIASLEAQIDAVEALLPPLRCFILTTGCRAACICHVSRCICRRAERRICSLAEKAKIDPILQSYMNRLSDYLFVLARKQNLLQHFDEKRKI